ncbi:MAG TPA: amino acid-binding protein [Actinomycetota bacterium]|jgi:hypothetical protein|nr:amino acid-binding protein [Actinomycetota bacterium]
MYDLTVILPNTPGTLATMGEALGAAGINIQGGCAISTGSETVMHVLVEDASKARNTLESAGFLVKEEYPAISFYVSGDDRPGILARYARRIADAGVNIERTYLATGSRLAFVTDDNGKARAAIRA